MSALARIASACAAWVCIVAFMAVYEINRRGPRK